MCDVKATKPTRRGELAVMSAHYQDDVLRRAERLCRERSWKLTPMRRRMLEALAGRHAPRSASALVASLSEETGRPVTPILVYRALDFLVSAGLIHCLAARNAFVPCDREHRDDEATVSRTSGML